MPWRLDRNKFAFSVFLVIVCGALYQHFLFEEQRGDGLYIVLGVMSDKWFDDFGHLLTITVLKILWYLTSGLGATDPIQILQLVNIGFSLGALVGVFLFLAEALEDEWNALFGALLVATAPSYWFYSETIEFMAVHLCALTWAIWWFFRTCGRSNEHLGARLRKLASHKWLYFSLAAIAVLGTHVIGAFWVVAFLVGSVSSGEARYELWRGLVWARTNPRKAFVGCTLMVLFGFMVAWASQDMARTFLNVRLPFFLPNRETMDLADRFSSALRQCFSYPGFVCLLTPIGGFLLLGSRFPRTVRHGMLAFLAIHFLFCLCWVPNHGAFFLPAYPIAVALTVQSVSWMATTFPPFLVVCLLAGISLFFHLGFQLELVPVGIAGYFLFNFLIGGPAIVSVPMGKPWGAPLGRAALIGLVGLQVLRTSPWIADQYKRADNRAEAERLVALAKPTDLILVNGLEPYILCYTNRRPISVSDSWAAIEPEGPAAYDQKVQDAIISTHRRGDTIYLSEEGRRQLFMNSRFLKGTQQLLEQQAQLESVGTAWKVALARP